MPAVMSEKDKDEEHGPEDVEKHGYREYGTILEQNKFKVKR